MTKSEALALQTKCETYFDGLYGYEAKLSMNLRGNLAIHLGEHLFTFDEDGDVVYFKFAGDWDEAECIKKEIKNIYLENKQELRELLWSYEHIRELEDG